MAEFTEVVEKRFRTAGVPRVRLENVAGVTRVHGRTGDEVVVRATKRAQAVSPDAARRLLENLDIEIEQDGDDIRVSHRAFLVERGWANLFRDRRAVVDYDIELPTEAIVSARSASGDVVVHALDGAVEVQSVSGDITVDRVRGPMRLRTVSGDCVASACVGALEANSVSGDLRFLDCACPRGHLRSVSGDIEARAELSGTGPYAVTTVSGDVTLVTPSAFEARFHTTSGDASAPSGATLEKTSRREWLVRQGADGARVEVHTVSGDFQLERGDVSAPEAAPPAEPEAPAATRKPAAMAILEALAKGELDVEEASRRLDARR